MKYRYDDYELTLEAEPEDLEQLQEILKSRDGDFWSAEEEVDFMEGLLADSELEWLSAMDCGDLTSAPILGITDHGEVYSKEDIPDTAVGSQFAYSDMGVDWFVPIISRWGYMDYEVRSFLDDLLETGKAVFVSGEQKP